MGKISRERREMQHKTAGVLVLLAVINLVAALLFGGFDAAFFTLVGSILCWMGMHFIDGERDSDWWEQEQAQQREDQRDG